MKFGVYTAILHDRPLPEALAVIKGLGLDAAEINVGGFLPSVHMPTIDDIITSKAAAADYLGIFDAAGVELAGLNANGNPLHPADAIGPLHADDLRRAIRAAGALGQTRVVTMSGLPGGEPGSTVPNWIVNAWGSGALDVLDYQYSVAVPFWKEIDALARDNGVKVAIEMHPQNLVFSPPSLRELIERTGATNVGAELDPSHLFWQGMDPIAVVRDLGPLVFHAAAKDVRINPNAALYGVLDNRFRRLREDEERTGLGGNEFVNEWPKDSAWDFVALGLGHDQEFWTEFVRALHEVDPEMAVHIEHEDVSFSRIEGLEVAAAVLREAAQGVLATR